MQVQISQGVNEAVEEKKKAGFVKSPREIEYQEFGPDSPFPAKWRVYKFIKYRIQDNKRESETEIMSREFIIKNTGINPKHFSRIIQSLEKDKLIQVVRGKYRDSSSVYSLHKERFPGSVVCHDKEKPGFRKTKQATQKSKTFLTVVREPKTEEIVAQNTVISESGDNSKTADNPDIHLQNGVEPLQSGAQLDVSTTQSLTEFPFRSLSSRSLELNPRAIWGRIRQESFTQGVRLEDMGTEEINQRKAILREQKLFLENQEREKQLKENQAC